MENHHALFDKWIGILRVANNWDVKLELVYNDLSLSQLR